MSAYALKHHMHGKWYVYEVGPEGHASKIDSCKNEEELDEEWPEAEKR